MELRTHDLRFQWRGPRPTQARIAVVAISDDTLQAWPEPVVFWGSHYADVIRQAQTLDAAWIGLDIIQAVDADKYAPQQNPTAMLARALQEGHGGIVLSNLRSQNGVPVNPVPRLTMLDETVENVGFVDLPLQTDDTVRTAFLFVQGKERPLPSFAALLAARVQRQSPESIRVLEALVGSSKVDEDTAAFWINYTGQQFPSIPAERLVTGQLSAKERQLLSGAVVLIGVTHRLSNDKHLVPGGGFQSGIQVIAQSLATLLDKAALQRWTPNQETSLTLVLALLLALSTIILPFGRGLLVASAVSICWGAGAMAAFASYHFLLPVCGPLLGIGLPWLTFQSARSLEEGILRLYTEAVFGRYVSSEIRDYVLDDLAHQQLGGQEREGSVLFVDLRGSTAFAEGRPPKEVMQELNACFQEIVPAIDRHRGLLLGYRGDGFLAVFGVPYPLQNHAQAAMNTATEIVSAVHRRNAECAVQGLPVWKIGCGLHSGLMVCGNLGVRQRLEFTVIGDTVNLGARLEEINKELESEIVLSEAIYARLEDPPAVLGPQEQVPRGRTSPVRFYWVGSMEKGVTSDGTE